MHRPPRNDDVCGAGDFAAACKHPPPSANRECGTGALFLDNSRHHGDNEIRGAKAAPFLFATAGQMMTFRYRCLLAFCAAAFVGCDTREKTIHNSPHPDQALPEIGDKPTATAAESFAIQLPTASSTGLSLDPSAFDADPQIARASRTIDWHNLASLSFGISSTADLRFAELKADEEKKTSIFEQELKAGIDDLNRGKFAESIAHFEAAEKANARDFRPFFYEAVVRMQQDSIPRAESALDIAIRLAPEQLELYLYRGNLRSRQGHHGLAVDDFSRVIQAYPENLSALINRAAANFQRRRPKDVVDDASTVIRLKSGIPDAHLLRALGLFMQGETVRARRDFEAAVAAGLAKPVADSWGPIFRGRT